MLHMQGVTKVYRTAMVETHALRELSICTCAMASSSR
jgi:hypothetical protein